MLGCFAAQSTRSVLRVLLTASSLCFFAAGTGCSKSGGGGSSGTAPSSKTSPAAVLATTEQEAGRLAGVVGDAEEKPSIRYLALRQLEVLERPERVALARELAHDPKTADERAAHMIRENAVAVLIRAEKGGNAEARTSLDELILRAELAPLITILRNEGGK